MYSALFNELTDNLAVLRRELAKLGNNYAFDETLQDSVTTMQERLVSSSMLLNTISERLKTSHVTIYTTPQDLIKAINARREESFAPDVTPEQLPSP